MRARLPDPWQLARMVSAETAERLDARRRQLRGLIEGGQDHRPTDAPTLRVAAVELARRGMTARDIAGSLGLTESAVRQLLAWERA